jgi:small conductance mechanosensitive channel
VIETFLVGQTVNRQTDDDGSGGGLVSDVGDEIKVTLDRWSTGQLDFGDLMIATAIVTVGALLAWLASRIAKRMARKHEGAARAAVATAGILVASLLILFAVALALEVLGFSLGPILILSLLLVVAVLILRPLITNLSSGVLLQVRGAIEAGNLVRANGVLGVVREINARSVVVDSSDGRRIHLPNTQVLAERIENYSTLGRLRSSFELMVSATVDLDVVTATLMSAFDDLESVLDEPRPEVQVVRVAGNLVVLRAYVWHEPTTAAARTVVDEAARSALAELEAAGVQLDGPQWTQLDVGPTTHSTESGVRWE